MSDPYDFDGIDFDGEGYFVFGDYPVDPRRDIDSYDSPWELWVATLSRARLGNFSWVPCLLDVYNRSEDLVLDGQCVELLGDAAPSSTVSQIRESIVTKLKRAEEYDPQFAVDMSSVLFAQRRLADVPLLLKIYQDGVQFEDTDIIISYMEAILGGIYLEGGSRELVSDSESVLSRYHDLLKRYGTDEISLWEGELFTVVGFAKAMLADIVHIAAPRSLRRIFEAATGIDCRCFFKAGVFQPLAAAALLEEFIESPEDKWYEPDVRYFFGHRIPD